MEEERYQLISIKAVRKEMINRALILGVLVITTVSSSSIAGIFVAKAYNKQKLEINNEEISIQSEEIIEEPKPKIPVYSEDAKQRIGNIYVTESEEKIVYLTFDDGPSQTVTPQILEILKNEEVKATFFVLGSRVELYPEIVKQEYNEGHYIANHGYSHVYTDIYSSPNSVLDEYNATEIRIKEALGLDEYSSHLFRFPGGSEGGKYVKIKDDAKKLLEENNVAYINWNCLTSDSVGKPTYESIIQELKKTSGGKNKIVVLMHDTGAKQLTADALPEIIHYLKDEGYSFKNFYDIMY